MRLLLVGINHRTASLSLRERFAVSDPKPLLENLTNDGHILEAVLLSTCNRVEVCVVTESFEEAERRINSFFYQELGGREVNPDELNAALYHYSDADAVRHIMRVTSSIDSMVIGEPQILGQVKDAYRLAIEASSAGTICSRLYQMAFYTAKRVRNETRIFERSVSIARIAVELALRVFESLDEKSALLIGSGEMTELALQALCDAGLTKIRIANRTKASADILASKYEASAHSLDDLEILISESDIVLTSVSSTDHLLSYELIGQIMASRARKPLFVIDIGVPRNVSPEVDTISEVYRYDLDDLAAVASRNAEERRLDVETAEDIVLEESQHFKNWISAQNVVPTIKELLDKAERIRKFELEKFTNSLELNELQSDGVEHLTKAILNKLLHAPLIRLKRREGVQGLDEVEMVRSLFDLDCKFDIDVDDGGNKN